MQNTLKFLPAFIFIITIIACNKENKNKQVFNKDNNVAIIGTDTVKLQEIDSLASEPIYNIRMQALEVLISQKILSGESKKQGVQLSELVENKINKFAEKVSDKDIKNYIERENITYIDTASIVQYLTLLKRKLRQEKYTDSLKENTDIQVILMPAYFKEVDTSGIYYHSLSNTKSKNVVYIISDYKCPACRKAEEKLDKIYKKYINKVEFRFVYFSSYIDRPGLASEAASYGGYSLLSDEDVASGMMANSIIAMSGVGQFSNIELQKKLAGKIVKVSPFIDQNDEGFNGNCQPADFETMLQLTYLYFTQARKDETAYSAFMQRMNAWVENKKLDPNSRFRDTISVTMADSHQRIMPFNSEMLSKVEYEKVHKIYQDRFKDAKDFVFIFVGNIDAKEAKPLIDAYIGGLPSNGREETFKDNNIRTPKGFVNKELRPKLEIDKSTVYVNYSGEYKYTPENNVNLAALRYILSLRYIETIREEEGGSYGVGVRDSKNHFPYENYQMKMKFDCAPEKSKYLTSIIYREIEKIKKEGPTEKDLTKTIEYFKKTREEQLRENSFWKSALLKKYYHGYDPTEPANFDDLVNSLTTKSLKKAANMFFNNDNHVQIVMMPED